MGFVGGQTVAERAAPVKPVSAVTRLMLTNFRSYAGLDLNVDARGVVLTGPNGAGKTNVLEAISMLAPGRGLRGVRLGDLSRAAPGDTTPRPWAVAATVAGEYGETQIGAGYMPGADDAAITKRTVRIDGAPAASAAALAERLRLVWLTPAMDRLFVDGASDRRRFLDRLIIGFDPAHARRWSDYETAMRERMSALKNNAARAWLDALERTMAEHGVAVAASRRDGLKRLNETMTAMRASAFPMANVGLEGELENLLDGLPAVEVEDRFVDTLRVRRAQDLEAGRTARGPHATDLIVHHAEKGREARACSTGEQKSLLIRLVLAGVALPSPGAPDVAVLLLDEIAAHLDEVRRRALFDEIEALGVQAWMTGTDASAFAALEGKAQFLRVGDGAVRA